jgi:hypothetical protein
VNSPGARTTQKAVLAVFDFGTPVAISIGRRNTTMTYRNMTKGFLAAIAVAALFSVARPAAAQSFRGEGRSGSRDSSRSRSFSGSRDSGSRDSGWRGRSGRTGDFRGGIDRRGGGFRGERFGVRDGWRGRSAYRYDYAPYGYVAPYPVYDGYDSYADDGYGYDGYAVPYDGYSDGYAPGYAVPYARPYARPYAYGPRVNIRIPVPRIHIPFPRFHVRIGR